VPPERWFKGLDEAGVGQVPSEELTGGQAVELDPAVPLGIVIHGVYDDLAGERRATRGLVNLCIELTLYPQGKCPAEEGDGFGRRTGGFPAGLKNAFTLEPDP
jgi:hypothetical protein